MLLLIYAAACMAVALYGFCVLVHMTSRTPPTRRLAFILLAWGGAVGVYEMWVDVVPLISLPAMMTGLCALIAAGMRWPPGKRARYKRPV